MITGILKKIGRLFIILTHEDSNIESAKIKNILLITLPLEEHLYKAIKSMQARFKNADFKIILPNSKTILISQIIPPKNIFAVASDGRVFDYVKQLQRFKSNAFDIVIILSLNPYLIWKVYRKFKCPKLLYNFCDERYLIRYKTICEFLAGEKGADRQELDRSILSNEYIFPKMIKNILKLPLRAICIVVNFVTIGLYITANILLLTLRRLYVKNKRDNTRII